MLKIEPLVNRMFLKSYHIIRISHTSNCPGSKQLRINNMSRKSHTSKTMYFNIEVDKNNFNFSYV